MVSSPSCHITRMELSWSRIFLRLAGSFRTAQAKRTDKETLWVQVSHQGVSGWGEAVPMDTYHQTLESAEGALAGIAARFRDGYHDDPWMVDRLVSDLLGRHDDQRATVAAVDAAIHDWIGKRAGISTARWLGLDPARIPLTSYTIGIDDPEAVATKVREAASYPILKVKVGTPYDEQILSLVREQAPEKVIRVDANAAWTAAEAIGKLPMLAAHGVEFVEQPIPPGDRDGLRRIREAGVLPIVADESCVRAGDVATLAGCVDGINIKLSKCGGIREALKMIHIARGVGLKVMLGCMIESSLGIAAAAQLAPLADWLDLDGHLLLANDPFSGLGGSGGRLTVGARPGLGVQLAGLA